MCQTVGNFLVHRLQQWRVRHVFGYPGDSINDMFGALNRADGSLWRTVNEHVTESSAMAEASGLASDEAGIEHALEAIRGTTRETANELPTQRRSLSETLRKGMIEAPPAVACDRFFAWGSGRTATLIECRQFHHGFNAVH